MAKCKALTGSAVKGLSSRRHLHFERRDLARAGRLNERGISGVFELTDGRLQLRP